MFERSSPVGVVVVILIAFVVVTELWAVFKTSVWYSGDVALIELRTRDVLSVNPPLVGAYSRYGWSHPGPLLFYLFAIPYRVLGGDARAMRLTALFVNTAAFVVIVCLLSRRGRLALATGSAAIVALIFGLSPHALFDSWNVTIAILPFALVIVACWCALCGDRHALLIASIAYAFVLQTHVGFGVVLAPMFLTTVVVLIVQARRTQRPIDRRACIRLGGALTVVFLPVIYDTLAHFPGNIGRLLKWSLVNDEPKVGIGQGLRVVARSSSLSFLREPQLPTLFTFAIDHVALGTVPGALLMALVASVVIAARRGWRAEALLGGILLMTWLAAIAAVATVTQPLYFWLIEWLQPLAWLSWCSVALVMCRSVAALSLHRTLSLSMRALAVELAAIVLIVASVTFVNAEVSSAGASTNDDRALKTITAAALTIAPNVRTQVSYDGEALAASSLMEGMFNQLDRAGYDVCIDSSLAYEYGDSRVCNGQTTRHLIVRGESSALAPPNGATVLAIVDPLTAPERAEADSTTERLTSILIEDDRADEVPLLSSPLVTVILQNNPPPDLTAEREAITRLSELRQRDGTRIGLYLIVN